MSTVMYLSETPAKTSGQVRDKREQCLWKFGRHLNFRGFTRCSGGGIQKMHML